MTKDLLKHLRVLEPHPNILAFYDGRVAGHQFMAEHNWVDDGALSLGIASYAIFSGKQALVYDTHVSVPHAQSIRDTLTARGVTEFTVVLSHWHLDHVAGTHVFADSPVIANRKLTNTATVFTDTPQSTTANDAKSATLDINDALLDVLIKERDLSDPVGFDPSAPASNLIVYEVKVQNRGPSLGTGVKFTEHATA